MPAFTAADGTEPAYHVMGEGEPLLCLPGGPMRASAYFGDLGGLAGQRRLVMLDLRGTGDSEVPADPATYRCDRQVADVEALRDHLGSDRVDVLAHSAGGDLALLRAAEPWFGAAQDAYEAVWAGSATDADWDAIAPFFYGRWDAAAQAHAASEVEQSNAEAADMYASSGAFDPAATRAAIAALDAPVLVLAGELDSGPLPRIAAAIAEMFPEAELAVRPGAGHFRWLDDPRGFTETVEAFLTQGVSGRSSESPVRSRDGAVSPPSSA
jgi:pimeloyl-ACP methyl ester carboxylesterase